MKKSGMKMMGAIGLAKLGKKSAKKRKPAAAGAKRKPRGGSAKGRAMGGALMMKKSAAKLTEAQKKLPAKLQAIIKKKEDSAAKMKKAAMKLKKDSMAMMKKSAMEMKKVSVMKMKMKKK